MSEEDYQRGRRGGSFRVEGDWDDWKAGRDDYENEQRDRERQADRELDASLADTSALLNTTNAKTNLGDHECPHCLQVSLKRGASRCPLCRGEIGDSYWNAIRTREQAAAERQRALAEASAAARQRACDAAVVTVKLGIEHTEQLWEEAFQEAKKKQEAQGRFSRMVAPLPPPSDMRKYRFERPLMSKSSHRWTQPVFVLGIVTLDTDRRLGFKHYRFATPFEYLAVLRFLKTTERWSNTAVDETITAFTGRFLDQDWSIGKPTQKGENILQDYAEALQRCREGAAHLDVASQYELGRMHANGQGVQQDYAEALKWYRKAADQGHAGAQRNIGIMYASGQAVAQDYAEALKWYRKAADNGDAHAMRNIGIMHANGQAVAQDYAEALKWYRKAADNRDAHAQRNIGLMYDKGQAVVQDYAEALKWYRKAADNGDAQAMRNIGWMYVQGQAVPQDFAEARKWYRKAADQEEPQFYIDLTSGKFDE